MFMRLHCTGKMNGRLPNTVPGYRYQVLVPGYPSTKVIVQVLAPGTVPVKYFIVLRIQ